MENITCPHCGYSGMSEDFYYIYESTIYVIDEEVQPEERDRPVLIICPRCRQGFFIEDPYWRFHEGIFKAVHT